MLPERNEERSEEICVEINLDDEEEEQSGGEENPLVQQTQLTEPDQIGSQHSWRILDLLAARPSASLATLHRTLSEKEGEDEVSAAAMEALPSPSRGHGRHQHHRIRVHFIRRINWKHLMEHCKEWLENPMNMAFLLWLLCVAVSSSMLGLLLIGLLDKAFPSRAKRNRWIEINNQVLNALFTLMSLYQHPNLFHHLVLLCRWNPRDVSELRKIYCKDGARRPRERAHMAVVLALLHLSCFSQYVLCELYWEYTSDDRPEAVENVFNIVGIAAPVFAGLYTIYSPLGREHDGGVVSPRAVTERVSVGLKPYGRRFPVARPEWAGGLFDCNEDPVASSLSLFCIFCVFGWNMERLGFGNMYIHTVTFLLLFVAPLFIFGVSALNIHNDVIADVTTITGRVLSVLCLFYGGFWRIQIRKRFKLPGSRLCCGSENLTDYLQWTFCWACSLAQEVRTGNLYDVVDDSLYKKSRKEGGGDDEEAHSCLQPLSREAKKKMFVTTSVVSISDLRPPVCVQVAGGASCNSSDRVHETEEHEAAASMVPPSQVPMLRMDEEEGGRFVGGDGDEAGGSSSPLLQGEEDLAASSQASAAL